MYDFTDTIVAVSSPSSAGRVIIRITGPQALDKANGFFTPALGQAHTQIVSGRIRIEQDLELDAVLYVFGSGRSYTGEDVIEVHLYCNSAVTQRLIERLLEAGLRLAGPGEFTARAYLNGKMDLTQAEAVNKIVTSSNRFQLAAAQKLLAGRLSQTTSQVASQLLELLSLIEAGLDFSEEDISFISTDQATTRLGAAKDILESLLAGSISYEALLDLPSVGIAGAPNAGKSSLLNALLGQQRSIVSRTEKTTRDVLTGVLELPHNRCVLFDCAGLISEATDQTRLGEDASRSQIEKLAQQAAVEALSSASVVVFCVDVSKQSLEEDISIRKLIKPSALIATATKYDLLKDNKLTEQIDSLNKTFDADFIATSSVTRAGLEQLRQKIDAALSEAVGSADQAGQVGAALTARHRDSLKQAIVGISDAIGQLQSGNSEIAAMMIRSAYQAISNIKDQPIDEKVLDTIFSQFCIGK